MSHEHPASGLGRGLGSLIPTAPEPASAAASAGDPVDADRGRTAPLPASAGSDGVEPRRRRRAGGTVAGAYFAELPISQVRPNARQPRQVFEEEALAELVHSIREVGLLQPVVVRRTGEDSYELIMGERRWRASQEAGRDTIPAIVRETDDDDMLRDALLENLHRSQLNPLEEAAAYGQLLEDFGCTHEELAPAHRALATADLQHAAPAAALAGGPAPGRRRRAVGRPCAGAAQRRGRRPPGQARLAGSPPRASRCAASRRSSPSGVEDDDAPRVVRRKPVAPGLAELADRLSDRLETRVKVDLGKAKGKITVEFASLDDLRRIVDIMDPRNRDDRPI